MSVCWLSIITELDCPLTLNNYLWWHSANNFLAIYKEDKEHESIKGKCTHTCRCFLDV